MSNYFIMADSGDGAAARATENNQMAASNGGNQTDGQQANNDCSDETESFSSWTVQQLKEYLANRHTSSSGKRKHELVNNADAAGADNAQAQRPGAFAIVKTLIVRMVIIYAISSFFRRGPSTQQTTGPDGKPAQQASSLNVYPKNFIMDMYVYISQEERFDAFDDKDALFWLEEQINYGDWTGGENGDGTYEISGKLDTPNKVMNNGTLFMHVYFVESGKSPNPKDKANYNGRMTIKKSKQLNRYKKRKFHTTTNLLTGKADAPADIIRRPNESTVEIASHWHPNITISLVDDHTPWMRGAVPAPLDEFIDFIPGENHYYPILYFNDYWNLNQDYQPINETTRTLNLTVTYAPLSLFKWQMYAAQSMRNRWSSMLGGDLIEENDDDQDSLKQTFLDTNPVLLGLTIVVSIVHSIFEFLAFKNDIQFWRNRKSLEGLSVRSVFFNVFQSLIVLLYVLDNETNFVIRVSVFIGLGIEIWKIHKVVDIKIDREVKWFGLIPRFQILDKSTYIESETKKYDRMAFKYLSWLLYPLLACYAVYSLFYQEHRGWYSWVLSMLYGFLLTFGFIMMTPQLFINYKLKSVAHLPWRMLTYKALNTFIDDLFAFVIKMPTLYRLGCFRDDIIFLIYLYQRWIYRVDPKRVNEFGTSAEMFDEDGNVIPQDEVNGDLPIAADDGNKRTPQSKSPKAKKSPKRKSPKSKKEKKND